MAFKNKRVWHSNLKYESPLVMQFTSGLMESQFKADEFIIFFKVRGDTTDGYYYVVESDTITERLKNTPTGQWLTVVAKGSAEEADLVITAADNVEAEEPQVDSQGHTDLVSNYVECLTAACDIADNSSPHGHKTVIKQHVTEMASTLFINWSRSQFKAPLFPVVVTETEVEDEAQGGADEDDGKPISEDGLPF